MKVTLVWADDWSGVYFGNDLVQEDHSIDVARLLKNMVGKGGVLGVDEYYIQDNTKWLNTMGCLPAALSDVYKLEEGV